MKNIIFFSFLLLWISCSPKMGAKVSYQEAKAAILAVMEGQEKAWSNGDIDQFMEGYWKSDQLTFIGKSGINYGWQTTLDNYKRGYASKEAMGSLEFDVLSLVKVADDAYYMIGKYTLTRKLDQPSGYYTLLWRQIDGQWKIVADHTSG